MIWLGLLLIGAIALLPLLAVLRRPGRYLTQNGASGVDDGGLVDERSSALALYRGQLADLERDRELGLVPPGEFDSAKIEIQRRLLAADRLDATPLRAGGRRGVIALMALIPLGAVGLYLVNGRPELPPAPAGTQAQAPLDPKMAALIDKLTTSVQGMKPTDPGYAQGHALLGEVEEKRGQIAAALADYHRALAAQFEPGLALRTAELQRQRDGHITADTLSLYRRALDAAPKDAAWRMDVEARIAQGEHDLGEQNPN